MRPRAAKGRTRRAPAACGFFFLLVGSASIDCGQTSEAPSGPLVVRIGVPEVAVSAANIGLSPVAAFLTTEGLTTRNHDGRIRPLLAESWTSSDNGLTWRFYLRSGVTFHDGTLATADVVAEALRASIARQQRRGFSPGLEDIVSVQAAGPAEIGIRLRRRSTFLLEDLEVPISRVRPDKSVVATGAFKTVSENDSEIVLEAYDAYHQGRPQIDRVNIRAYPTLRTAWASLMRKEIDVLWDLSRDAVEFAGSSDVALYSYLRQYVYTVGFNSARGKFTRTSVRRALNAAIDRDALIRDVLGGQGVPATGPIWPHHWAYDPNVKGYVHDPLLASATLDAIGLKPVSQPDGRRSRFTFTCILPENWANWERMALNIQKQLYDVAVDMQLQVVSAEEFDKRLRTGDFDAVMVEMLSGPFLSRPYSFWRWGGEQKPYNVFGYRNSAADRWFDAIRSAPTDAEYRVAVGQLQRVIIDDPPALFLAWSERTRAASRRFHVPMEPGRDPIPSFWRWTVNHGAATTH
jgi:peptide/nickel transport system substrate-binding protein